MEENFIENLNKCFSNYKNYFENLNNNFSKNEFLNYLNKNNINNLNESSLNFMINNLFNNNNEIIIEKEKLFNFFEYKIFNKNFTPKKIIFYYHSILVKKNTQVRFYLIKIMKVRMIH